MNTKQIRNTAGIFLAAAMLCLISAVVFAADPDFSGTWKGELGGAAPAGFPSAATGGAPAAAPGGAAGGAQGGRGGGSTGGRGAGAPASGGGQSARSAQSAQKITLHIKAKKDKASGNLSMGSDSYDVKDGKIDGNKLTFKAGLPEKGGIYDYEVVLNGDELTGTRKLEGGGTGGPGATRGPGGRGGFGGGEQAVTLKRN